MLKKKKNDHKSSRLFVPTEIWGADVILKDLRVKEIRWIK